MGGQEILVELLAGTIAASLAAVALHFSYKLLDPNRAAREARGDGCLLYTSPSPRDQRGSRMPSSA